MTSDIQEIINKKMREKIDITAFVREVTQVKVANTHGVYCPMCGSNEVYCEIVQLRSSDEASDKIFTCLRCGYTCKNKFLHDNGSKEFKKKIEALEEKWRKSK